MSPGFRCPPPDKFRRSQRVHDHEHVIRFDHPFQQLGIGGLGRAVVPRSMWYPSRLMAIGDGLYSSMALLLLLPSTYSEMKISSQKLALSQSRISTSKNELLKLSHSTPRMPSARRQLQVWTPQIRRVRCSPRLGKILRRVVEVVLRESTVSRITCASSVMTKMYSRPPPRMCTRGDRCVFHAQTPQG